MAAESGRPGTAEGQAAEALEAQRALLFELYDRGDYTQTEVAELFSVSRATVYRELQRRRAAFNASCEAHIY